MRASTARIVGTTSSGALTSGAGMTGGAAGAVASP